MSFGHVHFFLININHMYYFDKYVHLGTANKKIISTSKEEAEDILEDVPISSCSFHRFQQFVINFPFLRQEALGSESLSDL